MSAASVRCRCCSVRAAVAKPASTRDGKRHRRGDGVPSSLNTRIAAVRSSPPCDGARPVTFSTRTITSGRSSPSPRSSRTKCQTVPDCAPANPARPPARDKPMHGDDAHARAASRGDRTRPPRRCHRERKHDPVYGRSTRRTGTSGRPQGVPVRSGGAGHAERGIEPHPAPPLNSPTAAGLTTGGGRGPKPHYQRCLR